MPDVQPFAAMRYATDADPDLSSRIAPPYDVIDAAGKAALLARDPRNFVAVDLPIVPAKAAGPPEAYAAAADRLAGWLADGTLVRDSEPALYVYHQEYQYGAQAYVRRMFFARLRLEPFGSGGVFPHEQTFGGPKEDRLCLTRATRANLSPIFALFDDPGNEAAALLERGCGEKPLATGLLDGVRNRVWAVRDAATIEAVRKMLRSRPVFIADGHHRYGTSLMYRDELAGRGAGLPPDHPANFVLCVLCAMGDPGLLILPTHRVLPGVRVPPGAVRDDAALEISHLPAGGPEAAVAALAKFGPQAVGLFECESTGFYMIRPRDAGLLVTVAPRRAQAWRALGLAFLHAYLIDRLVSPNLCGGIAPEIHYVKSADGAVREARESAGSAFLLQPTTMAELSAVCLAGELMPQKSTYFYPKLASGLVVNPLS